MNIPKWMRVTSIVLLAVILVGVAGAWGFSHFVLGDGPMSRCPGHERFDSAAWQDSTLVFGPLAVRGCMVDNLLSKHRLSGQSRASVVALLGEPRPTNYFRDYDLVYWLGPERSLISVDSEWLVMRLDPSNRVTEVRLTTD
jgi:hypothetical protein